MTVLQKTQIVVSVVFLALVTGCAGGAYKEENVEKIHHKAKAVSEKINLKAFVPPKKLEDAAYVIIVDKKGRRSLVNNKGTVAKSCTEYPSPNQCISYKKKLKTLAIQNTAMILSEGSYIFTYYDHNGNLEQICYNMNWDEILCSDL